MKPYSIFWIDGYYPDNEKLLESYRTDNYAYLNSGESWVYMYFASVPEMIEVYSWFKRNKYRVSIDQFSKNPEFVNFERVYFNYEIQGNPFSEFHKKVKVSCFDMSIKVTVLKKDWIKHGKFWQDIDKMCEELSFKTIHDNGTPQKSNIYLK